MKYKRLNNDVIEVYRNKRKPIRRIKEMFKNEDGCIACDLFDVCLVWGKEKSICERMVEAGVITKYNYKEEDHYFINVR